MIEINKEDIEGLTFNEIASLILNKYILNIKDEQFGITEIEFYNYSKKHPDPYVQLDDEQKIFGNLYFNKTKNGIYKTGINMGININLGDNETYFYILIRSIINIKTRIFTEMPNKCVELILDLFKCKDIDSFMKEYKDDLYNLVSLKKIENNKLDIFFGPRVGLVSFSATYFHKKYRYAVNIKLIKKQNNFISINNTQNEIKTNIINNVNTEENNINTEENNIINNVNTEENNIINNVIIEDNNIVIKDNNIVIKDNNIEDISKMHKNYTSSLVKNSIYNNIKIQSPKNNIQENINTNINKPIPVGMI